MRTICASSVSPPTRSAADQQTAGRVDRSSRHASARFLLGRNRFAGDHRFVDGTPSFDDDAVNRHLLARPHSADIADARPRSAARRRRAVAHDSSGLRRETQQLAQSRARPAARPQFEDLTEQDKHGDHRRRIEVASPRRRACETRRERFRERSCRRRCTRTPLRHRARSA